MRAAFNAIVLTAAYSAISEAKQISETCLHLSNELVGQETGDYVSNSSQLTSPDISDQMRLHSVTTCTNSDGSVTGLQLFLSLDPYSDSVPDDETIELDSIGSMTGNCQTLSLTG